MIKNIFRWLLQVFKYKKSKTKFILISTQRSGTTFLSDLLNSHPDIYMTRELFKTEGNLLNVDSDNYRYFNENMDVEEFLNQFFEKYLSEHHAAGFTIMLNHLIQYPSVISYIHANNVKCIYLERSNRLKTALSRLKARATGVYHTTEKVISQSSKIDIDNLMKELAVIDNSIDELRTIIDDFGVIEILYEKLQYNQEETLRVIQEFLSVSFNDDLHASLQKTNNDDLQSVIENYDELREKLQSTHYARYLL